MIEQPASAARVHGRRAMLRAGAALGALSLVAAARPVIAIDSAGWRFCPKCRGLVHGGDQNRLGICPAGGKHTQLLAGHNYVIRFDVLPQIDQIYGWYECRDCRGLFYGREGKDICPAGGKHKQGAIEYALWAGAPQPNQDTAWGRCRRCGGMFNWAGGNNGRCPKGGRHSLDESYIYKVTYVP